MSCSGVYRDEVLHQLVIGSFMDDTAPITAQMRGGGGRICEEKVRAGYYSRTTGIIPFNLPLITALSVSNAEDIFNSNASTLSYSEPVVYK
jgi:hypothetical protein